MRLAALAGISALTFAACGGDDSGIAGGRPPIVGGTNDASVGADSGPAGADASAALDGSATADASADAAAPPNAFVYVASGAYGAHADNNIYGFTLDGATGALTPRGSPVAAGMNPTYMAFDTARGRAFVTNESGAMIAAFALDRSTGALTFTNRVNSGGDGPTFVGLTHDGGHVLVGNYTAGSLGVFAVNGDGSIGASTATRSFGGTAQTHCARTDAADHFLFVMNKGLDQIAALTFDANAGAVSDATPPTIAAAAGPGPRHLDFHPNGRFAYLVTESASTLVTYAYDAAKGALTSIQTTSTLPPGSTTKNTGAEVQVAPSGKFVYASNRGDDSIAAFSIDGTTGKVTFLGTTKTGGKTPRHFMIDASGRWLLAGNIDTDNVTIFRVDAQSGALTAIGAPVSVPSPGFVGVVEP